MGAVLRSLSYRWRMSLAVAAGSAVATAVLTGALVVGDSLSGSLERLSEERLGSIDLALVSDPRLAESLAGRLEQRLGDEMRWGRTVPALMLPGSAVHGDSEARAGGVTVLGVDERFVGLWEGEAAAAAPLDPSVLTGSPSPFRPVVLNGALARELGAEVGDPVVLTFEGASAVPRESLLGERDPEDRLAALRLTVAEILPDRGIGRFALAVQQSLPKNAFVSLPVLQRALARRDEALAERVNTLLLAAAPSSGPPPAATEDPSAADRLLAATATLDDLGVTVRSGDGWVAVESRELVLRPAVVRAVRVAAAELGAAEMPVLTYLANSLRHGDREVPYSALAALPLPLPEGFEGLMPAAVGGDAVGVEASDGAGDEPGRGELPAPPADGVLIDAWLAEDLGIEPGAGAPSDLGELELEYFVVGEDDRLETARHRLRIAGVVAMEGLATDPALTPDVPGVADTDDMASWDPPFPVDLDRVRPRDEQYWDLYRAAPKAFLPLATGQELWRSRFGELTSVRLAPVPGAAPGTGPGGEEGLAGRLRDELRRRLAPDDVGLSFRPVRTQGIAGAAGSTDFSGLFLAFSMFLIVSAALLVALLFGLAVEQRAPELGLLLAVGYPLTAVRRRLLAEAAVVSAAGGLAGVALALGYARALLSLLAGWWAPLLAASGGGDALGLGLSVEPASLAIGFGCSLLLVLAVVWLTVRRLSKVPARGLLAGGTELPAAGDPARREAKPEGRWPRRLLWLSLLLAAGMLAVGLFGTEGESSPALAFGVGAVLLVAGCAAFALWCRRGDRGRGGDEAARPVPAGGGLLWMAARSTARNRGRSLLAVVLVACASFVLVTVAANRRPGGAAHGAAGEAAGRGSGTGGFALVAEADIPLPGAPDAPQAAADLGFSPREEAEVAAAGIYPFRLRPGDDASCLNLYQPGEPRILGVPPGLVERGGFRFASTVDGAEANPWELLELDLGPGVVPAIGDYESVRWILKLGLGDELTVEDDRGEPLRLRLVALLDHSLFQSELLISERYFLRHFPSRGGYRFFLADAALEEAPELTALLESRLGRFGLDVQPAAERLAAYEAVQAMYLTTFQALGGLGLLLGTLGLGVVLARNVLERRGELATLRAFGYRRATLGRLVVAENAVLLAVGLGLGTVAGLAAVAPRLLADASGLPWSSLALTLGAVALAGMLACTAAVAGALRTPLLPALKREG